MAISKANSKASLEVPAEPRRSCHNSCGVLPSGASYGTVAFVVVLPFSGSTGYGIYAFCKQWRIRAGSTGYGIYAFCKQ
jgi:hypothetical protein